VTARAEARQGVNGDFIEVTSIFPNTVDLIVGDVMGKGPLAALMGADVKLQIQRYIAQSVIDNPNQLLSVAHIINAIHAQLTHKLSELDSFVTLAYIRINCTTLEQGLWSFLVKVDPTQTSGEVGSVIIQECSAK
jgi:serine phosphatase RsbU (regulator of sigma subunit)